MVDEVPVIPDYPFVSDPSSLPDVVIKGLNSNPGEKDLSTTSISLTGIDASLQQKAEAIFAEEGLSPSDVYRRLLLRTVEQQHIPLDLFRPNAETIEAMKEARRGNLKSFGTVEALMTDLNAED